MNDQNFEDFDEHNQIWSRVSIAIENVSKIIEKQIDELYVELNRVTRPYSMNLE